MLSSNKNSEAQQCANTLGLLSNKSRKGNIDMNTVANYELKFQNTTFHPVIDGGHIWLTSTELACAQSMPTRSPLPNSIRVIRTSLQQPCQWWSI